MKTTNNVQKTILRSVAVVVSFVLISLTVSGQDFWKKLLVNSSLNEIALAMVETPKATETSENISEAFNFSLLETENDPTLVMENWMIDDNYFGVAGFEFVQEYDNELEIEEWMLNGDLFQVNEEVETSLELEAWMTSEKAWGI
ncbi:MAG: hypothetical protein GQ525_08645 [Draconibacterium sp.]|nr:hypothetical protein [Draconibacterium sp.]